jgi:hypothetical protein
MRHATVAVTDRLTMNAIASEPYIGRFTARNEYVQGWEQEGNGTT